MVRYVMLIKFTELGITHIDKTTARADQFRADAAALGVTVEALYWTLGEYDGVVILSAADAETVAALTLHLASRGNVRTCLMQAFAQDEFTRVLAKMPARPAGG